MPTQVDLIIKSRGPWLTLAAGPEGPRTGAALRDLGEMTGGAAAITSGFIVAVDRPDVIERGFTGKATYDFGERLIMPGFVDAHTHPVFAATREAEFELRNQGATYVDIAKAGGGIRSSVRALRSATLEELTAMLRDRADRFLALGTTTIEAKSGYGLSTAEELKSLHAIRAVDRSHPLDFVPTFMGAHEVPDEYQGRRAEYVDLLVNEMIPAVGATGLAHYCDVFCEAHVFTVEESRRILEAARAHGMEPRLHADEIEATGGAELAADVRAVSADHLVAVSERGVQRLAEAGVIPILLPGTSFYLKLGKAAPARAMIDAGLPIALATDFNPGSCPIMSMPAILSLACLAYGLTAAEAICAATVNAAYALGLGDDRARLATGLRADILALDVASAAAIPYHFADNRVAAVLKNGVLVAGSFKPPEPEPPRKRRSTP
jgi:imidazolonepropionase